jgi:3-(3-hydroxy-phenyl)propionate hydroxylase
MQPDGVWRIDFQLGWDANPDEEKKPENIIPRVKQMLAHTSMKDAEFELEWASVYTFACLRMDKFRHGRIFFAGDAAHGVSPFGARGANSGVQDAENLGWKLAAVLQGRAPDALLDSYAAEREYAADENILNSTRATDFITPKSEISRLFRDAVLDLSKKHPFARTLVNSGRLSVPSTLRESSLNTPVSEGGCERMVPGTPATDAPVLLPDGSPSWLLRQLGSDFTALALVNGNDERQLARLRDWAGTTGHLTVVALATVQGIDGDLIDAEGLVAKRYELEPGSVVLLRPDQHVCARGSVTDLAWLKAALQRAHAAH